MAEPNSTSEPGSSTSTVQTVVSLLLFVYLFGVALAMLSYTSASPIEQRLLEVMPYLKVLDIDPVHSYPSLARWHLTHFQAGDTQPVDVDFRVEITSQGEDGKEEVVTIPPPGIWPPQRLRRYQSLANVMGCVVGNEELEGLLPKAIAGSILRQAGSRRGKIRILAHDLPSMEDLDSDRPERRDPNSSAYRRVVYEAQVLVGRDSVNLLKTSAAGEVAPVERGGGRSDGATDSRVRTPKKSASPGGARP